MLLPRLCPKCGDVRASSDRLCECGARRPPEGWPPDPFVGAVLTDPRGWVVGPRVTWDGETARYQATSPQGGPQSQGWAMVVWSDGDWSTMVRRSTSLISLRHPNIQQPLGIGRLEGASYRVDPLPPEPLADTWLQQHGAMEWRDAVRIALALASALSEMHARGLVHGHLCLETCSLVEEGGQLQPVLHSLPPIFPDNALPRSAPEIHLGGFPDPRTDIFGLSYVLTSLIRGRAADDAVSHEEWRQSRPGPAFPAPRGLTLPDGLAALIEEMADRDPERRVSSLAAISDTLRDCLAPPPKKPSRAIWALLPIGAIALAGGLYLLDASRGDASPGAAAPETPADVAETAPAEVPAAAVEDAPAPAEAPPVAPPEAPAAEAASPDAAALAAPPAEAPAEPPVEAPTDAPPQPPDAPTVEDVISSAATDAADPDAVTDEIVDGEAAPEEPAAEENNEPPIADAAPVEPPPPAEPAPPAEPEPPPLPAIAGSWQGSADGRTLSLDLQLGADGSLSGRLSQRLGATEIAHGISGSWQPDGSFSFTEQGTPRPRQFKGQLSGGAMSGQIYTNGRARGSWSASR